MAVDVLRHELDLVIDGLETAFRINFPERLENGAYLDNHTVMDVVESAGELLRDAPEIGLSFEEVKEYQGKIDKILRGYD
jgi:hypothetical protein